jgi:hypothetical protein
LTAAERAFISIPGRVRSIEGLEMARVMPWVKDVFSRIKPGHDLSFPENNVTKCGNIISVAENREDAIYSAENAARSILIRLETPNENTEAFLATPLAGAAFPPNAFPADSRLLSLLEVLPENTAWGKGVNEIIWEKVSVFPFPEFTELSLTDYVGRSVKESLNVARTLTGMKLPIVEDNSSAGKANFLGRSFWRAFIRGGYQGAVYYIDSLRVEND